MVENEVNELLGRTVTVLDTVQKEFQALCQEGESLYQKCLVQLAEKREDLADLATVEEGEKGTKISEEQQKREAAMHQERVVLEEQLTRLSYANQAIGTISRYLEMQREALPRGEQSLLTNLGLDLFPIKMIQAQEEEYHRVAQEVSDGVGQLLANAIFELEYCQHVMGDQLDLVREGFDALKAELRQGLGRVRRLVMNLQPPLLTELGLIAALKQYVREYEKTFGIDVTLNMIALGERLPATMEIVIFRVIQEALQNIQKHSSADKVTIRFLREGTNLVFAVEDNGRGFVSSQDSGQRTRKLGLASMYHRAELLQGKLQILTERGRGTKVILSVPDPFA
ncbi:MAG: ATP-binding protein, partial [Anaerolineae bacterium]